MVVYLYILRGADRLGILPAGAPHTFAALPGAYVSLVPAGRRVDARCCFRNDDNNCCILFLYNAYPFRAKAAGRCLFQRLYPEAALRDDGGNIAPMLYFGGADHNFQL